MSGVREPRFRRGSGRSSAPGAGDLDARETRRAALAIGWQIMLASAVVVLGIVVIAIVFILHQALPREQIEADHSPGRTSTSTPAMSCRRW
ncbi:hypothetical protein GCM10025867_33730 [Frondihabitans sucicola]|uniref:Uncharacterized protein n=1 Tax=Frondihabitans sucicola TaxID=1268041 RepID=A0ABN6Y1B0_9MICO|nr:hypothetical protein [Frondihabitans sucicola]BDZ51132.1 hypothetical protein GCM10025867_33730 [Frondihabitans sucicola]